MSSSAVSAGARRGVPSLATLTCHELTRSGWFVGMIFLYVIWLGTHQRAAGMEEDAAAAAFLEHGLGGMQALLLMAGVFMALALATGAQPDVLMRLTGARALNPATWYWGRIVGQFMVLLAGACVLAMILAAFHFARFGPSGGEGLFLRSHHRALDWQHGRRGVILDGKGKTADFRFALSGSGKRRRIQGRFNPRLRLVADQDEIRSRYPVVLEVMAAGQERGPRRVHELNSGRGLRFHFELTVPEDAEELIVRVRQVSGDQHMRIRHGDLELLGPTASLWSELFRGAMLIATFAAVLAGLVHFLASMFSFGTSLLAACGLVVLSSSLEVFEYSILSAWPAMPRNLFLEGTRVLIPELDRFDLAGALARRTALGWEPLGQIALRWLVTAVLLGFALGALRRRRGRA